jgi:aspartyl-tRNA(Asn)/glutamyl-tRNA(Gln) amidotransferase subunit A
MNASEIAAAVAGGELTARAAVETALARIAATNAALGAFTDVTVERALRGPTRSTGAARPARTPARSRACPSR